MSVPNTVVMQIARMEATHLADLIEQFRDLLQGSDGAAGDVPTDPALARLFPDAYADDIDAARQFRELTASDLLAHRDEDARTVLASLGDAREGPDGVDDPRELIIVDLSPDDVEAWLRTLTSLRLVIASRLGIRTETDHDQTDPRFGIYEWLGYRLEGLLQAIDPD
ncbi:hypothetical protein GCM10022240_22990 [Microbacterium kribbense]|uniref:DUF2017 domain-containing protein n=1 Tax=Microbacterium kribbense TaxID=433645 RepID=A0ABP7GPD3_9MICO